jgi:hypothetical protein
MKLIYFYRDFLYVVSYNSILLTECGTLNKVMKNEERIIMRGRTLQVIIFCILLETCSSDVYALNLLGPPTAELEQGQFEFGLEHSYSRFEMDFDFTGGTAPMPDFEKKRMKMNAICGSFAYGINESVEGFASVGWTGIVNTEHQRLDVDGRIYGGGAKITLQEYYLVKWGILVQANIVRTDGSWYRPHWFGDWYGDTEMNYYQIIAAGGANYQLTEYAYMYGGPFCYYLDGEQKYEELWPISGFIEKYDLQNKKFFGYYFGMQMLVATDMSLSLEFQSTSHDNMLACGLAWKF